MSSMRDAELLEYLKTHKSSHVRRAVQKIQASFEEATTSRFPALPVTPIRRTAKASKSTTKSPVKRRIEELERKINEQSETTTSNDSLLSLSPRSRQQIAVSPRYAFNSPKQLWGNDDDTTLSTVSISSLSMSSSLTVDRPIMDISFERSSLAERPITNNMFGSSSDAIRNIGHITILDSSFDRWVSSDARMLSFLQDCPSETTLSNEVEERESLDKGVLHYYYFVLSVLLLCSKGVDPVAIFTVYLWLEIFRQHA
eukprot:scaffold6867_cov159-Skeletonema_menzelii.AAC.4